MVDDQEGRPSLEKRLKSWDDVRDAFNKILKKPRRGYIWHDRIAERYADGALAIHIHGGGICHAVCADREGSSPFPDEHRDRFPARGVMNAQAGRGPFGIDDANGQQRQPMLISVRDFANIPERPISSVVWLNTLDQINGSCWERTPDKTTNRVLFSCSTDREINLVLAGDETFRRILNTEFPRDVIQSAAQVMHAVPNNAGQFERWGRIRLWDCSDRLVIYLGSERLWHRREVFGDSLPERFEVLLSPDDFDRCEV